ncbi:MAG: YigZ family protein [Helicobacteraceae bacterium]|nr:YigZ family protein [Helicobacteraceae bacterium]
MKIISEHTTNTLEIKKSKFIAHITPFSKYEKLLATLKEEHPKARHFVTAFRYLNEFGQVVEGCSDDGEPKGTSGKPTLAVLQGSELINVGVVTVRYFGGTRLGTGGLVRAYGDATNEVIALCELSEYKKLLNLRVSCEYTNVTKLEYECSNLAIEIVEKEFNSDVVFTLNSTKELFSELLEKLKRLVTVLD